MRILKNRHSYLLANINKKLYTYLLISSFIYYTNYTFSLYNKIVISENERQSIHQGYQIHDSLPPKIHRQSNITSNLSSENQLTPEGIQIRRSTHHSSSQATKGIGYRSILEKKGMWITSYNLKEGSIIKLQNHSTMLVASFIFKGKLEAKIYSPTEDLLVFNKETVIIREGEISFIEGLRTNDKNFMNLKLLKITIFWIICSLTTMLNDNASFSKSQIRQVRRSLGSNGQS